MRWPWSRTAEAGSALATLDQRQASGINLYTATDGRDVLINTPDGWEVSQPWLWWTGPPEGGATVYGNPIPGADWGGYGARSLPAVQRCTSIICDTLAGLPWQHLRGDWETLASPPWLTDPQALRLDGRIVDPNAVVDDVRDSAVEFYSRWIRTALWYGDGYIYAPVRGANSEPIPPLWQLHPDAVEITEDRRYVVDDYVLPTGSILHLRGGEVRGDGHGTGVLRVHGPDLGLALSTRHYAGTQYRNGVPAGYLKSQQPNMTNDQAETLRRRWMQQHGTGNRSVAVLNVTTDFVPINLSPLDAQLDSARQWSLRDVALAFGLPPYMLGVPGDSSTYANVESRLIELRMFSFLNPWARRIESVLDAQFPRGHRVKIKTAGLERADTTTRYNAYKVAIEAGFMTVNEVRALEDLPPLNEPGVL